MSHSGPIVDSKAYESWKKSDRDIKYDELRKVVEEFVSKKQPAEPVKAIPSIKERLQNRIEDLKKQISSAETALEQTEKIHTKEGCAAFHVEHGHVLVKFYHIGDSIVKNHKHDWDGKLLVDIVTSKGSQPTIPAEELMPLNEATQILYGKK